MTKASVIGLLLTGLLSSGALLADGPAVTEACLSGHMETGRH